MPRKTAKSIINALYCMFIRESLQKDQIVETSIVNETFIGRLRERNKCRFCNTTAENRVDITLLNFEGYKKSQKAYVQNNRQHYSNLMPKSSKRNLFFLKQFEKFYTGVFDYLYDFLNRGSHGGEDGTFFCEVCKMTINCAKRYSFVELPEVLTLGFNYCPTTAYAEPTLPMKLDPQINLSHFVFDNKESEDEEAFTKQLSSINDEFGPGANKGDKHSSFLYQLKGAVQLLPETTSKTFRYIQYVNLKDKWYVIENGEQKTLKETPNIIGTSDRPIVLCNYERIRPETSLKHNLKSQLMLGNSLKSQIPTTSIPDEFVYKLLYLHKAGRQSLDFYFCQHQKLKPLFQDIYERKKKSVNYNNHSKFLYSDNKKFNKELKQYRVLKKNITVDLPLMEIENIQKTEGEHGKLRQTNTVELNGVTIKDSSKLDCSYARLHYLATSLELPRPLSDYLLETFNFTQKCHMDLKQEYYSSRCVKCTFEAKRHVLSRILQKALIMESISNGESANIMIDVCWFKNYRLFLLADINKDNLGKQLYNCNYVSEPFNVDIQQFYEQFRYNYASKKELITNEFVAVNPTTFGLLKEIYGCEQMVILNNNEFEFLESIEYKSRSAMKLSSAAQKIFEILKRLLGTKVLQDHSNSPNNIPSSARGRNHILDSKYTEEMLLGLFDEMLEVNKKMNIILKARMGTMFRVLEMTGSPLLEIDYKNNLNKIYKIFGTNNVDAIQFHPCQALTGLLRENYKDNTISGVQSIHSKASIDNNAEESGLKASNVVRMMDTKTIKEFFEDPINNHKRMAKTKTYLENLELSNNSGKKVEVEDKKLQVNDPRLDESYRDRDEVTIDQETLFSVEASAIVKKTIEKRLETKITKSRHNFMVEPRYVEDNDHIKLINYDDMDHQLTNRSSEHSETKHGVFKDEIECDHFLELEVQNSISQDLDLSSSNISEKSRLRSSIGLREFDLTKVKCELEASEIMQRDESREEDITLNSDSDDYSVNSGILNIKIPAYDSNEDLKPHKSPESKAHFETKLSQLPSKRSHFSRMGSVFVTDDSDSDSSSENTSVCHNLWLQQRVKESKQLARRNTRKMLLGSIGVIQKEQAYTIKTNKIPARKSSFMLVINKTPKTSAPPVPINLFYDDKKSETPHPPAHLPAQPSTQVPTNIYSRIADKHISVIRESTFESFEESAGEDHVVAYESMVKQAINTHLSEN